MKNRAYIPAIILLTIALLLHTLGDMFYIYTIVTWYDDPLHFISGLGLGFSFYWLLTMFWKGSKGKDIWAIVALVLVAATAWECFEAFFDMAGYPVGSVAYCVDTAKDIINGVLGSVAALIIIRETYEKKSIKLKSL
ncbi:MAG: hypothetical protein P4L61_02575 [Candidatus Pacebacteria bacterium]|nr:hypothetical protein [Candidatus Paceibacterota bacterium]